jgi:hypothetical protein
MNLNTYYNIVPINNGYTVLYQNSDGDLYLKHKEEILNTSNKLTFSSEESARKWLIVNNMNDNFKPEEFGTAEIITEFADL